MADPGAEFRKSLAALSREDFAEFVEDLWEAREREVRREGDRLVVDGPGGETTLAPVVGPGEPTDAAGPPDLVVAARDPEAIEAADARIIGPDALRRLLLYGVEREEAEELFARTFDRPIDVVTGDSGDLAGRGRPSEGGGTRTRVRASTGSSGQKEHGTVDGEDGVGNGGSEFVDSTRNAAIAVVVLLAFAAAVGGGAFLSSGVPGVAVSDTANPGNTPSDEAVSPTETSGGDDHSDRGGAATPPPLPRPLDDSGSNVVTSGDYPVGLGPDGVTDPESLADAHAQAVAGRSYRLMIEYREYRHGGTSGYRRETVQVEAPSVYRSEVLQVGTLLGSDGAVAATDTYAAGLVKYERRQRDTASNSYFVFATPDNERIQANRARRLMLDAAAVDRTSVVDAYRRGGRTFFWVRFAGRSAVLDRTVTGSILVDEHGVVHELRRRHRLADHPNVSVELVVRYQQFGNVTADAPEWVR